MFETAKETQIHRTVFWTLWEKARVGWSERIALKHVYYHMWNRLPIQVWCMRRGAQGWCTGMTQRGGWGGRWEEGSAWGTDVHPWLIHVNVWQNHYNIVISLQLKEIKKKEFSTVCCDPHSQRLSSSQWSRNRCFSGIPLLSLWSSDCWQFDL